MKFAKYLSAKAVPDWLNYYLDYKRLKKTLEPLAKCVEDYEQAPSNSTGGHFLSSQLEELLIAAVLDFQETFKEEVDKVEFFFYSRLKHCKSIFQQITVNFFELKYPSTISNGHNQRSKTQHIHEDHSNYALSSTGLRAGFKSRSRSIYNAHDYTRDISIGLESLSESAYDLASVLKHLKDNFIPLNKLAVYKIFKKHDKLTSKVIGLFPEAIGPEHLTYSEEILLVTKQERKFYYKFKDVSYLLEEVQHLQHELYRLTIRKRQDGLV